MERFFVHIYIIYIYIYSILDPDNLQVGFLCSSVLKEKKHPESVLQTSLFREAKHY